MHMSEEKKHAYGFRIKWADREIEYYGDSAEDIFKEVFEHVKGIPIASLYEPPTPQPKEGQKAPTSETLKHAEGEEYDRIVRESKISKEEIVKIIEFRRDTKYETPAPFLPKHPTEIEDAVLLVSYALQVGFQQTSVDVSYLKKLLRDPNGYQLPSRTLGRILDNLRRKNWLLASQAKKGRNKPFTLSEDGLEEARKLLKT